MGGLFGGLLGVLEQLGLGIQHISRFIASFLIGSPAWKWNLNTHSRSHKGFKEQRRIREFIGLFTTVFLTLPIVDLFDNQFAVFFSIILGATIVFFGMLLRDKLEGTNDLDDSNI